MNNNNTVDLKPFKKGDTPTFQLFFKNPSPDFNWAGITIDVAMTDVQAPTTNAGAAAIRLGQSLQVGNGGVFYDFLLTVAESKALEVGAQYFVEGQLKQGTDIVVTPVTAKVKILQDYIV